MDGMLRSFRVKESATLFELGSANRTQRLLRRQELLFAHTLAHFQASSLQRQLGFHDKYEVDFKGEDKQFPLAPQHSPVLGPSAKPR